MDSAGMLLQASCPLEKLPGLDDRRRERDRALGLAARGFFVSGFEERRAERNARGGRLAAPDGDLECVDRLGQPPGALMQAAEQNVRLVLVRREVDRPAQRDDRLAVFLFADQLACLIEVERGGVLLIALGRLAERRVDPL